jgi:hypothetical protein
MNTVEQLIVDLQMRLDKIDSHSYAEIEDQECLRYLNLAQDRLVKTYHSGNNPQRQGYEETSVRRQQLENLVVEDHFDSLVSKERKLLRFYELDISSMTYVPLVLDTIVAFTSRKVDSKTVSRKLGTQIVARHQLERMLENPFWAPDDQNVLIDMMSGALRFWSKVPVEEVYITYLKRPRAMTIEDGSCELKSILHDALVQEALVLMFADMGLSEYQTAMITQARVE